MGNVKRPREQTGIFLALNIHSLDEPCSSVARTWDTTPSKIWEEPKGVGVTGHICSRPRRIHREIRFLPEPRFHIPW